MSNGILDFLVSGLEGPQRDAVTRAFYEYAQGDPHSSPVGMATLLTACTRKVAMLPEILRGNINEMRRMADELIALQKDLLEKLTKSNHLALTEIKTEGVRIVAELKSETGRVITVFREQNAHVTQTWRGSLDDLRNLVNHVTDTHRLLKPIVTSAQQVAVEFRLVQAGLVRNDQTHGKILLEITALKLLHLDGQAMHKENVTLMAAMTKEARANWITIGYLVGLLLVPLFQHLPSWGMWASFGGMLGLLQCLSRCEWKVTHQSDEKSSQNPAATKD
jgi:uncharacterized membrane protein (DUF2068 family)